MGEYLVFGLHGALAAWGDIAIGEVRSSQSHPGRSAVLGLVAGSVGLRRNQEAELNALEHGYGLAVRIDRPGEPLRDYHTVQTPKRRRSAVWPTRRDELTQSEVYTVLSYRDYYCDSFYTCALWCREEAPYTLDALKQALECPRFPLYLGRKSCPPALPLRPQILSAATLHDALAAAPAWAQLKALLGRLPWGPERGAVQVVWDAHAETGLSPAQTVRRRDALLSRARWQYQDRDEHQGWMVGRRD